MPLKHRGDDKKRMADRSAPEEAGSTAGASGAKGFRIFLNYRREDASGHVGRLYDSLRQGGGQTPGLGKEQIFMDIDTIAPGVDFRRVIDEAVGSCDVFIAVIGKHWLDAVDSNGRRRLDKPNDFVRLEIEAALARDIPVVPTLVQGVDMPSVEDLPETLEAFGHRNAIELSDARWAFDVGRLAAWLKTVEEETARRKQAERERSEQERREQERLERERLERAAAELAEHERLEKEAAERAGRERQQREARAKADAAEREQRERQERAEAERLEKEAAEQAEAERLEREAAAREERLKRDEERLRREHRERWEAERAAAAEQAERQRQEKEAAEPASRRIRLPRLKRRYWIAMAAVLAGVAAIGVLAAVRLGGEAPKAVEEPEAPQASEAKFPNEAEQELLSHIPAGVRDTCSRYTSTSDAPAKAGVLCDMPNIGDTVEYRLVTNTEREADSLFGTYCLGEPRPWEHGEVCEDNDPAEGASLYWTDNRFSISGAETYSGVALSELRDEWRCCLQLELSAAEDIAEELRSLGHSTTVTER
jgi:TIR domain